MDRRMKRRQRGVCENPECGRAFLLARSSHRFCSAACRFQAWRAAHPRAGTVRPAPEPVPEPFLMRAAAPDE